MLTIKEIEDKYEFTFAEKDGKYADVIFRIFNQQQEQRKKEEDNDVLDTEKEHAEFDWSDPYVCHLHGLYHYVVDKNYDKMKRYYLMAIELNYAKSMNYLGIYYNEEEKNFDLAKHYYLMAVEQGLPEAMTNLGSYYEDFEKNYDLAKQYYLMAIEKKFSVAMKYMGDYFAEIEKDTEAMKKYYLMAIEHDHVDSMLALGYYYEKNSNDEETNYELMQKYYLMAIEQHQHPTAMFRLGYFYEHVEKDYKAMEKYYLMAIEQHHHIRAMFHLGYYYQFTAKSEKDYELMKKYYCMAIAECEKKQQQQQQRLAAINNNLGVYYQRIEKNYSLAKKYYLLASESATNREAMFNLGMYYWEIESNDNMMLKYLSRAVELHNVKAMCCLGHRYDWLVRQDIILTISTRGIRAISLRMISYLFLPLLLRIGVFFIRLLWFRQQQQQGVCQEEEEGGNVVPSWSLFVFLCCVVVMIVEGIITWIRSYHLALMKQYYLMAIVQADKQEEKTEGEEKKEALCAMLNLGAYYEEVEKDYDLMKYYCSHIVTLAQKNENKDKENHKKRQDDKEEDDHNVTMKMKAMVRLGIHYEEREKDYEQAKRYYLMAIATQQAYAQGQTKGPAPQDKDNSVLVVAGEVMRKLAGVYDRYENDYEMMKQYYFMAMNQCGDEKAWNALKTHFKYQNRPVKLYKLLLQEEEKEKKDNVEEAPASSASRSDLLKQKLSQLKQNKVIQAYHNKVRLFESLNNYKQCGICLKENVLNICLECGHEVCIDCYEPQQKCRFWC